MEKIESNKNRNIKEYIKLLDNKKYRNSTNSFCIEGDKLFFEALNNKVVFRSIFFTRKFLNKFNISLNDTKFLSNIPCKKFIISENVKQYIMDTSIGHDVFCICKKLDKQLSIDKIDSEKNFLFLCNVQNPGNLGMIIRSLDAFSIDGLILSPDCCDIYNPKVLRASMGSLFRANFYLTDDVLKTTMLLKEKGFSTYATVVNNSNCSLNRIKFGNKNIIYIGNEGNGLSDEIVNACDLKLTIDINPNTESLNVAVASSIIMWEMKRQIII